MGLFSRIIKSVISPSLYGVFLLLFSGVLIQQAYAADQGLADGPLGSHVDIGSQFANARHLWQSGKLKEAASLYESMIKHHPELPAPYNNLAVIYAAQGDYKKAQQMLEKGLNTNPTYAMIYENLTAIYVEMARDSYGKALQFVDKSKHQLNLRSLAELSVKTPVQLASVSRQDAKPPVAIVKPAVAEPPTKQALPVQSAPVTSKVAEKPPVLSTSRSVKPAVPASVSPVKPEIDQAAIKNMLMAWAAAWSSQSPQQYLVYYEPQYHPAGMTRSAWVAQRIRRLKRPKWIRVELSNFVFEPINEQRVRVIVQQRYQSNSYSDNERKEFILNHAEQGWRIASERGL